MELPWIAVAFIAFLALGYRAYGRVVERLYNIDPTARTPADRLNDGVDFVPTKPFYLFGQHFSAIAAAGPIAGPILASQQFGWLPALFWLALGAVFIGAVHDFSALIASVRHEGRSIAEVVRANLGARAGTAMLAFIWIALVYVIVAFTDLTASTFVAGDPELAGLEFSFHQGGAVTAASLLYLGLAVVMGVVDRYLGPPLWLQTLIFVPATVGAVALGPALAEYFVLPADLGLAPVQVFSLLILLYCGVASMLPVWMLLQPRGYLGGFVLYLALAVGVYGILFGNFEISAVAYKGLDGPDARTAMLFPFLFVTIACGACSGFHGLVCSGTTSKQIANESHCRPVGYGAMLLEGLVALIALATVMIAAPAAIAGKPAGTIYGTGLGRFLAGIIGQEYLPVAITFGAMAFSTFVFDTLDVSTRLGRLVLEELSGRRNRTTAMVATAITIGTPLSFMLAAGPGAYLSFWTLFGTSNQLLAALSLLGISVWLRRSGRRFAYVLVPAIFISAVTLTALVLVLVKPFTAGAAHTLMEGVNSVVALILLVLACSLMTVATRALLRPLDPDAAASPSLAAAAGSAPR